MEWTIENMFKVWRKNDPHEIPIFLKQVEDIKTHLKNPNAMSEGGTLMFIGEIPARIHAMMCWVFGQHWSDEQDVFKTFYSVFSKFRINGTSTPKFTDRPTTKDGYHHEKGKIWGEVIQQAKEA